MRLHRHIHVVRYSFSVGYFVQVIMRFVVISRKIICCYAMLYKGFPFEFIAFFFLLLLFSLFANIYVITQSFDVQLGHFVMDEKQIN